MIIIEKLLREKEEEIRLMIEKLEQKESDYPKGSLKIAQNKWCNSYYHCNSGNKEEKEKPKYIKKKDIELAKQLAQKSYENKVLQWAQECHNHLVEFMDCYKDNKIDEFYEEMSDVRKELVTPMDNTIQAVLREWDNIKYEGKDFQENMPVIMTENEERVRSKSEKILADKFLNMGIPYKYECPLKLKKYGIIYPDFTLLNVSNGKVYYWEHLGMMDSPEYSEKAIKKIESYIQSGIFVGEQLILSFETKKYGMNNSMIESLIQEYLLN